MKFFKLQDNNNSNILRCNNLNNDILFKKYEVKENSIVELEKNQLLILSEKGKILDIEDEEGLYKIIQGKTEKQHFDEKWQEMQISKSEKEPLSVIFLNRKIVKRNKYFIDKPIEYKEFTENGINEYLIKISGNFDFFIEEPKIFLSRVIGLRKKFPKQELIEQIRKYIIDSIEKGIKELSEEFRIDIKTLQEKSKELKVKLSQNESDKKLLEYGVKLEFFDIEKIEIIEKKKRGIFRKKY